MYTVANWRGKFINSLIKDLGLKSYLELGISKGWCWQEIELENKTGIEINPEIQDNRIIKSTTDDFFKANSKKFDIIFIDADHEKGQVFKDFTNAYEALNDRGLVLLHDVNPLQKSDVSLSDMGTAYAFWVNLVNTHKEYVKLFVGIPGEREGSIGLFFKKDKNFNPLLIGPMDSSYEYFNDNRNTYVDLVQCSYEDLIIFWSNK